MGCPQGSVLGPSLWNILFDDLLGLPYPEGCTVSAYADDALLLVGGKSRAEVERRAACSLDLILGWGRRNRLSFSPAKTQALLLKGRLKRNPVIQVGGRPVAFPQSVRYLGVSLGASLSYLGHAKFVVTKSRDLFFSLRRVSRAEWGIRSPAIKLLYNGVFVPQVAYAARVWAWPSISEAARVVLLRGQRLPLVAMTGAYRTTSTLALPVIAGILPIDLEILERAAKSWLRRGVPVDYFSLTVNPAETRLVECSRLIRAESLRVWQERWDAGGTGPPHP